MGKRKKKNYKKINVKAFLILLVVIVLVYIIVQKRENGAFATVASASIGEIIDIIEDKQASVSMYAVYGTHLNIEGDLEIVNPEIENTQIVVKKSSGEEIAVETTYNYESGNLSFSTLYKINQGINLEELDVGNYYILLKVISNNGQASYYSLVNNTEYTNPIDYYTLTRNNLNNKVNISFLSQNTVSAFALHVTTVSKLPDDVYDIVIDPGHGGKDPGAVGEYTLNGKKYRCVEKDVVLDCSTKIYRKLKEKYPDKTIMMTRTGDTYPSLEDRVEMANNISLKQDEAIIYVSVHANSSFSKTAKGYEVWYLSQDYRRNLVDESDIETKEILPILNNMMEEEFTMESILIAKFILDGLTEQIGDLSPSRGLKEENWFVVRNAGQCETSVVD